MKIAVLYICTGKYKVFWREFFISAEKYFLTDYEKTYFVFTDADNLYQQESYQVRKIFHAQQPWPGDTLFRFKMFAEHEADLRNFDYIFFMNANIIFLKTVGEECLPEDRLLVVEHPGFIGQTNPDEFPYDRNPDSTAYIPFGAGKVYVQGGMNGGPAPIYLQMIKDLEKCVDDDYEKNVVAKWHDESHLNKYIQTHSYKMLAGGFDWPDEHNLPGNCKILLRDKVKYGGIDFVKDKYGWIGLLRNYVSKFLGYIRHK